MSRDGITELPGPVFDDLRDMIGLIRAAVELIETHGTPQTEGACAAVRVALAIGERITKATDVKLGE